MAITADNQATQPPGHWLTDLLNRRYGQQNEPRMVRQPIGFDFKREPFDPSSYYKQLGSFRDISRAATHVVEQEVANRIAAQREQEMNALRTALNGATAGIQPQYTYDGNPGSRSSSGNSYGLSRITPNTLATANYFGPKHGISSVGGWREHGSVPNSDHPKGRALDFMIRSQQQGSALANDVISNYRRFNVSYVIWNRYIWSPSGGWRPYSGPSPHTDHVHVSLNV